MANPTVTASLNKASFAPGDTMTLTVTYADPDNRSGTVTVTVTDTGGGSSAPASVGYVIADPVTIAVTDSLNHTFTKQSDTGAVAVYTATA